MKKRIVPQTAVFPLTRYESSRHRIFNVPFWQQGKIYKLLHLRLLEKCYSGPQKYSPFPISFVRSKALLWHIAEVHLYLRGDLSACFVLECISTIGGSSNEVWGRVSETLHPGNHI